MGFTLPILQHTMRCVQSQTILRQMNLRTVVQVERYSRWSPRRPAKIVNEKELYDGSTEQTLSDSILKDAKFAFAQRQKMKLEEAAREKAKLEQPDENATLTDDGQPIFSKLAKDDPLISTLMITVKSQKKLKKDNRILLEGYRLIEDAMKAGVVPEIIIFSRTPDLVRLPLPKEGVKLYKIPYQTIQLWSDLSTSPGIMAICQMPDLSNKEPAVDSLPVTIICDNVREPGNLGAILRVAAGVGCERVILTKGCVDVWSPKVLRAAAGAHFRLQICKSQTWPEVQYLISENANIFIADNNLNPSSTSDATANSNTLTSDSSSDSDSSSSSDSEDELDTKGKEIAKKVSKESAEKFSEDEEGKDKKKRPAYEDVESLPIIPYFSPEYPNNESILIVGGETEGLSPESIALALRRDGVRVNVPLTNGVDSLNTGTALGVILFEIKRQFLWKLKNM